MVVTTMAAARPLHVLVVAPGARPARVLERALLRLRDEGRAPQEVHVVGPQAVIETVDRRMLRSGRFARWCAAHGLDRDEVLFNRRTLHAVAPPARSDCTAAAERVLAILRALTSGRDALATVMLTEDAGVTGYLVQASLLLVARADDRLVVDLGVVSSRSAQSCEYLDLPLVLWPPHEPIPATYAEAAHRRRRDLKRLAEPDVLRLELPGRTASVGDTRLALPPMQFFWLWYLATAPGERFPLAELTDALSGTRRQRVHVVQKLTDGRVRTFPADLQRAFVQVFPNAADKFDLMFVRSCGPHPGLPSTISKINAALRRALGGGARPYLIEGGRGAGGYRVTLPPSAIQIVGRS